MGNEMEKGGIMKEFKLMGIPLPMFAVIALVIVAGAFTGTLPSGMVGALAVLMLLGTVLG